MTHYSTITSKGQLTLPAEFRRALNLVIGQKVAITLENDTLILKSPGSIDAIRAQLQEEMRQKGTLHATEKSGGGWTAHVTEDLS
ncbi:MAG: AbrB/MazE/SpoVT family DNA-binding domain-containing protein [Coriobacteriia bacterium]|nr:AbrB/MazE/SpoVT family DNA-binding domain-containing protein [Coriobacteriia bacterium]